MQFLWRLHPSDPPRAAALGKALGVHPLMAQLLLNRGVTNPAEASRFLRPTLGALDDPRALPDMARAVARLSQAITQREPVLIFGDSDVDGLTANVILYEALKRCGALVRSRQSNRIADGYGLPPDAVQRLCRSSTKILVLVDCGTNQPEEVRRLAARGIDVIIIDHHVPLDGWAEPYALVNPHRTKGPGRELCSAGLAFKVARTLLAAHGVPDAEAGLDLAALGTLADCSPLIGESRILVSEGLSRIIGSRRPGLQQLCRATRLSEPDPDHVIRRLVPRLNASGRLGDPVAVWNLLRRDGAGHWETWMGQAEDAHTTTKQLHRQIAGEAEELVNRLHFRDQFVMVVSRAGWHQGLMGPLASQLTQRYGRPAIAIAIDEHHGTGSGRSVPLVNLPEVLRACQDLLVRFGGHAQACGLTLRRNDVEPFRALVNEQARRLVGREGLIAQRVLDLELPLDEVTPDWVEETARLAPFGHGNPRPTVMIRRLTIDVRSPRTAVLSDGRVQVAAKGSFAALADGERYDVAASPTLASGELVLTVSGVRGAGAP